MRTHGYFGKSLAALGICVAIATSWPAAAQNSEMQSLVDQIERLRNDIVDLQRTVFKGAPPPPSASVAGASGGMTAERAAQIEVRVSQVEDEMRGLTGRVEEVGHDIDRLGERLDKMAEDIEFRLTAIERKQTAAPSATPAVPPQIAAPAADTSGTLGTVRQVPRSVEQPAAPQTATLAPALPPGTPEEQYKYANDLLRQMEYGEAERALKAFIEMHPGNNLTGNAYYWLAETFYVRGNYEQAAQYFARGFQDFPKSIKAPDNLLKLAMSLAKLGRKDDACLTFTELGNRFPNASSAIKQLAANERRRDGCT